MLLRIQIIIFLYINVCYADTVLNESSVLQTISRHDSFLVEKNEQKIKLLLTNNFEFAATSNSGKVKKYDADFLIDLIDFSRKMNNYSRIRSEQSVSFPSKNEAIFVSNLKETYELDSEIKTFYSEEIYTLKRVGNKILISKIHVKESLGK